MSPPLPFGSTSYNESNTNRGGSLCAVLISTGFLVALGVTFSQENDNYPDVSTDCHSLRHWYITAMVTYAWFFFWGMVKLVGAVIVTSEEDQRRFFRVMNVFDSLGGFLCLAVWIWGLVIYAKSDACRQNYDLGVPKMWTVFQVVLWCQTAILCFICLLICLGVCAKGAV